MKMKNLFSTLALVALFVGGAKAQTSLIISPEIGIHTSKTKETGDLDLTGGTFDGEYSSIFSYQGGVGVGIQFADTWGIMTGLKYNRKGGVGTLETRDPNNQFYFGNDANGNPIFDMGEISVKTTQTYLSIPILARAQFGNAFKVGLAIGPQINMGLGKYKQTIEYSLERINQPTQEEESNFGDSTQDLVKKSHVSLLVLPYVSYEFKEKNSLRFSVMIESSSNMVNENYVVSGTDINGNTFSRNVDATMKNTQFGFMLSYEYRFDFNIGAKY